MKVGVLGLGSIGLRHARNIVALGHEVAAYDPSAPACSRFETETGRKCADRADVMRAADAIVIATPSQLHLGDLQDAIELQKPIIVEKPLGHSAEAAARVVGVARQRGIMLAVAHNLRFRPVVKRVREILAGGELGMPVWARFTCASWLPDWRPDTDYRQNYAADPVAGGVIFDAIHELDLAAHLLGPATLRASAAFRSGLLDMPSEDVADIVVQHASGCQSSIHLDYITRPRTRTVQMGGPGGCLTADLRTGAVTLLAPDGTARIAETISFDPNEEYLAVMRDFLTAAESGGAPACAGADALATLEIACEARSRAGLKTAVVSPGGRQCAAAEVSPSQRN